MSQLAWFTPPRTVGSATERRRFARYPAGRSLRGRLAMEGFGSRLYSRIHSISTAGISLLVSQPFEPETTGKLQLTNVNRGFSCELVVHVNHVTPYRGDLLAGGTFERELSKEELERLTPTLSPWLEIEPAGEILIGRFTGPDLCDERAVRIVGEQLCGLVEELGQKYFVLNLEEVRRANCSFLSQLIEFRRRVKCMGGRMALCSLDPLLQQIFETTLLTRVFAIYSLQAEAVRSFDSLLF